MPANLRLGKKPAVADARLPHLTAVASSLPNPPPAANWLADVENWQMLGNDSVGDCVAAAAMHVIFQQKSYLTPGGRATVPTAAEAIHNYSAIGGYDPSNPASDQGLAVLGSGGLIEYWARHGLLCGGVTHKLKSAIQIGMVPREWQQAISLFGSVLLGMQLPAGIADADSLPYVWSDNRGPAAGGHEVLAVGYQTVASETLYDIVTWGQLCRCTEAFLLAVVDEVVVVSTSDGINAAGVDAAGINQIALANAMKQLQQSA